MDNTQKTLQTISLVLARQLVSVELKDKNQTEKIIFLSRFGYSNEDIALVLDASAATIAVRLSEFRKKNKTKK
jgi:DNA-binding NarL/FixJ family response regulator